MENREMTTKTNKQESDSFGLKIMMAILAVAVVVLTLINAAPFSAKGETKAVEVPENNVIVSRNIQASYNADRQADVVEF